MVLLLLLFCLFVFFAFLLFVMLLLLFFCFVFRFFALAPLRLSIGNSAGRMPAPSSKCSRPNSTPGRNKTETKSYSVV